MRAIVRLADIAGSSHALGVYRDQNLEYGPELQDEIIGSQNNFTSDTIAWDRETMRKCVCDSSWKVGLQRGQTQLSEWFGPDCSLQRCPTGDDPSTSVNERHCQGQNQISEVYPEKGHVGNWCHIDCSNRGVCNYKDGKCSCFEGHYGLNCGRRSIAGLHDTSVDSLPDDNFEYPDNSTNSLIY
jgi:hypothetical protein|tara:strand:+ start:168 stop:719 length:552 start_codon:yes stop_codon:yes gene_type:complete